MSRIHDGKIKAFRLLSFTDYWSWLVSFPAPADPSPSPAHPCSPPPSHLPRFRYVDARLAMLLSVSRCSLPQTLLSTRTYHTSFSLLHTLSPLHNILLSAISHLVLAHAYRVEIISRTDFQFWYSPVGNTTFSFRSNSPRHRSSLPF